MYVEWMCPMFSYVWCLSKVFMFVVDVLCLIECRVYGLFGVFGCGYERETLAQQGSLCASECVFAEICDVLVCVSFLVDVNYMLEIVVV